MGYEKKIVAIVGGSGFSHIFSQASGEQHERLAQKHIPFVRKSTIDTVTTLYGEVVGAVELTYHREVHPFFDAGHRLLFLPRHGCNHSLPPHGINYRANVAALKKLGVSHIISTNAVGGIAENCGPQTIVLPDQIIDYTYGRPHTFFDDFNEKMQHIDFSYPFRGVINQALKDAVKNNAQDIVFPALVSTGTYGCTQGPRLETAAEIQKLKNEGCSIVGMTVMPEAALAREKDMDYASISLVVNWAAGVENVEISMDEIIQNLSATSNACFKLIDNALVELSA